MSGAWYHLPTLQIRSKNSSGAVLHTYSPMIYNGAQVVTFPDGGTPGVQVTKDNSNVVIEQRQFIDYTRANLVRGLYATITVVMNVIGGTWLGATGFANLEAVMADRFTAGNTLEISLDSGTSWHGVDIDDGGSDSESKLEGKNIGLHREMTFLTTSLYTTEVAAESGGL